MVRFIATCGYLGYLPASGTCASLAALGVYYAVRNHPVVILVLTACLLIAGFWASGKMEDMAGRKDPHEIVIDEFSAQLLVFVFVPYSLWAMITGFFLFRLLDIVKLPPVRRLESLPRGIGIMCDDIAVALVINAGFHLFRLMAP
ncbi:MAG: phosphatidylglycerophosphatase A [Candidatus Omnitrophica bacterium]|nr:phosphatidylglycerophosphatase A [Candidatus Omnitrophota bacterium]